MQCQNNLKQLGLAMHMYHDVYHAFMTGQTSSSPKYGHMVLLLPFIEQGNLANAFNKTATGGFADPLNQPVANTRLAILRCPSNPVDNTEKLRQSSKTGTSYGAYITNSDGSIMTGWTNDYWVNHRVNSPTYTLAYPSVSVAPNPLLGGTKPTLNMVTDGLSNTTMVLEHAGYDLHYVKGVGMPMPSTDLTLDQPGSWGAWLGWCAFQVQGYQNYTPDTYPTNVGTPAGTACAINCNNSQGVFGFHAGGANVAMCDGSVRMFAENMGVPVLMALVTRDGGEVVSE
jgi:prepilin-type processing-associated H-X9-DG protein